MEIRFATLEDTLSIVRSLQNKHINYNTPAMVKEDIKNHRLVIAIDNNKIVGQIALVYEPNYAYTSLKRLCVYNNKNRGKGIASALVQFVCETVNTPLGASPWTENTACINLFKKFGFKYQYTYLENYNFYLKNA